MKGIVFSTLTDMVEEKFGLEFLDQMLIKANLSSQGVYTAGSVYPDAELFTIVATLSEMTGVPQSDLICTYGEYLFGKLTAFFPGLVPAQATLKQFLKSIDRVIHVEVRKIHPNAELPTIKYEDPAPNQLVLLYHSPRKLCALARGLMQGASAHYHAPLDIQETACMHHGATDCRFELTFAQTMS